MQSIITTWRIPALVVSLTALSACNLLDDETNSASISGSVGDGPIVNATITIYSASGAALANAIGDQNANYDTSIEAKAKHFPLLVGASDGIDLVTNLPPDFSMITVVPSGGEQTANISPFSTLIVATAQQMDGGLTTTNIAAATNTVTTVLNSGLTSLADSSPIETKITDANLPEMVRASETLAEILRRVNSTMVSANGTSTIDSVIEALGSDLVDGMLDGQGGPNTNPRITAVTAMTSAQTLLETMTNSLHVNGVPAAATLDDVITQLAAAPVGNPTASLPITETMIAQVQIGLEAAAALGSTAALDSLRDELSLLQAGMQADEIARFVTSDASSSFDSAITSISSGSESDVEVVTMELRRSRNSGPKSPTNSAPVMRGSPARFATVGVPYSFEPTGSDPDGDPISYSISNKPAWTEFNTATGRLAGTPRSADIGTTSGITVSASDAQTSSTIGPFRITVEAAQIAPEPNSAPEISGTPPSAVSVGATYTFTPNTRDADGDELRFNIENRPSWLLFNSATGTVSGVPQTSHIGTYTGIVITASDSIDSASLGPFSITVEALALVPDPEPDPSPGPAPGPDSSTEPGPDSSTEPGPDVNTAPTISGNPANSVAQDSQYSFQPSANDSDGDDLSFGILNKPSWASFSTANGSLVGTPTADDIGTFSNITIYVSDGAATSELPTFSISVEAAVVGSATLQWQPPTENEDGTALVNLGGFNIYWGPDAERLSKQVELRNPGLTSYVVENLAAGTYVFSMTAVNTEGMESQRSDTASMTIQ